ncbi:MAG: DUF4040 domain-containing protein [Janthinobacterium lividum]
MIFSNIIGFNKIIDFELGVCLLIVFLILLIMVSFKLIFLRNLLENVIFMSAFSLLISICYLLMDAPDVAMTEVALGACLSTCVLLNFIKMVGGRLNTNRTRTVSSTIICGMFVFSLTQASLNLPRYGDSNSPLNQGFASKYYLQNTQKDIGIPSPVAAILASYRGYDTLGETSVILIAGLAVLLILSPRNLSKKNERNLLSKDG